RKDSIYPDHFCTVKDGQRLFRCQLNLGGLNWYEGEKLKGSENWIAGITVPKNAQFVVFAPFVSQFAPGADLPLRFHPDDLDGVLLSPGTDSLLSPAIGDALNVYFKMNSLRYIDLRDWVSKSALQEIAQLPKLRGLVLQRTQLLDSDSDQVDV